MKNNRKKKSNNTLWVVIVAFIIVFFWVIKLLSVVSIDAFLFLDKLVQFGQHDHPFVLWGVFGALLGPTYGTYAAVKKYKLDKKIIFIPLAGFIIVTVLLAFLNKPFQ